MTFEGWLAFRNFKNYNLGLCHKGGGGGGLCSLQFTEPGQVQTFLLSDESDWERLAGN